MDWTRRPLCRIGRRFCTTGDRKALPCPLGIRKLLLALHQRSLCRFYKLFRRLPYHYCRLQVEKNHRGLFFFPLQNMLRSAQHPTCHLVHLYNPFSTLPITKISSSKYTLNPNLLSSSLPFQTLWHPAKTHRWFQSSPTLDASSS